MGKDEEKREYDCSTTLIITGDDLDPNEVTKLLGFVPNQAWKKDQKEVFPSGNEHIYK